MRQEPHEALEGRGILLVFISPFRITIVTDSDIREMELFLFGGLPQVFDGIYRPAADAYKYKSTGLEHEISSDKTTMGFLEIDWASGEMRTYDSHGRLDKA
jgi:hypothetical protein